MRRLTFGLGDPRLARAAQAILERARRDRRRLRGLALWAVAFGRQGGRKSLLRHVRVRDGGRGGWRRGLTLVQRLGASPLGLFDPVDPVGRGEVFLNVCARVGGPGIAVGGRLRAGLLHLTCHRDRRGRKLRDSSLPPQAGVLMLKNRHDCPNSKVSRSTCGNTHRGRGERRPGWQRNRRASRHRGAGDAT